MRHFKLATLALSLTLTSLGGCSAAPGNEEAAGDPDTQPTETASEAVVTDGANTVYPKSIILVHGYLSNKRGVAHAGKEDDFFYWQGKYSDNVRSYDVPAALKHRALVDANEGINVYAANWDGRSKVEDGARYLVDTLNRHCTYQSCALVGHSTGDAIIGYTLAHYFNRDWKISFVYNAGGAAGGTEAAGYSQFFSDDPVVPELVPKAMRGLYDHDMPLGVFNIRFLGSGIGKDNANNYNYPAIAAILLGDNDGLVPFSSQAGIAYYESSISGNGGIRGVDSWCRHRVSPSRLNAGCGQVDLGRGPMVNNKGEPQNLWAGFRVAYIDEARTYNHSDEVGMVGTWIPDYIDAHKYDLPFYSSAAAPTPAGEGEYRSPTLGVAHPGTYPFSIDCGPYDWITRVYINAFPATVNQTSEVASLSILCNNNVRHDAASNVAGLNQATSFSGPDQRLVGFHTRSGDFVDFLQPYFESFHSTAYYVGHGSGGVGGAPGEMVCPRGYTARGFFGTKTDERIVTLGMRCTK